MKIILLQDVKTLGKKGDVVEVSAGYARNMILPKKLGVEATAKNLNDLQLQNQHADTVAQENLEKAQELAKDLEGKVVEVKIKTGEGGKIFGSVSTKEIAAAAKEQIGFALDKKKMQFLRLPRCTDQTSYKGNRNTACKSNGRVKEENSDGRIRNQAGNAKQLRGRTVCHRFHDHGQRSGHGSIRDFNNRRFLPQAVRDTL